MHIRPLTPITCHMATECDTILLPCTMPLHYTSLCKLRQKSLGQGLFLLRPYPYDQIQMESLNLCKRRIFVIAIFRRYLTWHFKSNLFTIFHKARLK